MLWLSGKIWVLSHFLFSFSHFFVVMFLHQIEKNLPTNSWSTAMDGYNQVPIDRIYYVLVLNWWNLEPRSYICTLVLSFEKAYIITMKISCTISESYIFIIIYFYKYIRVFSLFYKRIKAPENLRLSHRC